MDEKEIMELKLRYYEGLESEIRSHARDVVLPTKIGAVGTMAWTYILEPPIRMIWMAFFCFHLPCVFWLIQGAVAFVATRTFYLWLRTPESFEWTYAVGSFMSAVLALYTFIYLWAQPPLMP
jgi:hypothetical protein